MVSMSNAWEVTPMIVSIYMYACRPKLAYVVKFAIDIDILRMVSFHSMAIHFLVVFSLLNVAFAGRHGHGALSSEPEEVHWNSVFPNTPMPKALINLLPPPPTGLFFS
ncbi:hypothetical protein V6N13_010661 [Hibiscus sabdariffa]